MTIISLRALSILKYNGQCVGDGGHTIQVGWGDHVEVMCHYAHGHTSVLQW